MDNMLYSYCSITLFDAMKQEPTLLDFMIMDNSVQTELLKNAFLSMWNLYDIGGETIPYFKLMIENKFNMHKKYYQDKINEYEKELDYTKGYYRLETENETGETTSTASTNANETSYDLPYRQTQDMYATRKGDQAYSGNGNVDNTVNRTSEKVGGVNVLVQKITYLDKYIRNLYKEFAYEFKDCFAMIYL